MNTTQEEISLPPSVLTKSQTTQFFANWQDGGHRYRMTATVRHDDQCGNGHNTFAITAEITEDNREFIAGCCHEEIAKRIPELAPLIKWHLTSTDGPMHMIANTVYHASDRDCWGLRKGELQQHTSRGPHQNGGVAGVPQWELEAPEHKQIYAAEKPAPVTLDWKPSGMTGKGKERNLDAARHCAVWPEATDAELLQEPEALKAALIARMPQLMLDFKAAVESLGFVY